MTDYLFMNAGDDLATGGEGDDRIFLGAGQDETVVLAEDGSFDIAGMEGDDFIRGGNGRDVLVDAVGSNTIFGDLGYDRINTVDDETSQDTADRVYGGFGNDTMFLDDGDVATGGAGFDRFQILGDGSDDAVIITDFEDGDTLLLRSPTEGLYVQERITTGLTADGNSTSVMVDGAEVAVLSGVTSIAEDAIANAVTPPLFGERTFDDDDKLISDDFDDTLLIGEFGTSVVGFAGDDIVRFADDISSEGRDMDVIAGAGDDTVILGEGDDSVVGGLGADTITSAGGADEMIGGYGNDIINVTNGGTFALDAADTVFGGAGDDVLSGDNGDILEGGDGTDDFFVRVAPSEVQSMLGTLGLNPDAAAVTISDFDPAAEELSIEVDLAQGDVPVVSFVDTTAGADVLVEGQVVASLLGVQASALNATNVTVANANQASSVA